MSIRRWNLGWGGSLLTAGILAAGGLLAPSMGSTSAQEPDAPSVTSAAPAPVPPSSSRRPARRRPGEPSWPSPVRPPEHSFQKHVKSWRELRTENVVMQERDYSCGAAALATILKYHWGDDATETQVLLEVVRLLTAEELRERVQNGLTLTDLRRTAVKMDYQASIGRLELDTLRQSKIPLIVGIIINDFDHFVVYRGMDDRYVYLADPARGNVRTPIAEFQRQWQRNLALVVVKKGGDPNRRSPLAVSEDEKSLGELNDLYLRDQTTAPSMTLPR